nr:unnamed protein product [Callosobruchus chinensis]
MRGEEYLGYSRGRDGKIFHNTMRESKSMGPTCISEKCVKYKNRFCDTILQEQREIIFQKFWKDLDWDQKKIYVTSLMHKKPVSRRYVKLNHREISLPFEYVNITKNARQKPFPYDAEYLEHQFFKNYDDSNILRYKSIRPGRTTNDPTVTNIRVLNYEADGKIRFKLNFEDDLAVMPQRSKEIDLNYSPKRLYQNRRKISNVKYVHLQDMKTTLTKETQHYYDNLPYE